MAKNQESQAALALLEDDVVREGLQLCTAQSLGDEVEALWVLLDFLDRPLHVVEETVAQGRPSFLVVISQGCAKILLE
ncbi:MAG: hypothetical protein O3C43_25105 [Verrucomicrobia bacterium]|nr:hypothetical protein [Verrucomicrobiota bacterium]MDA1069769.1 hypothetical protein [Verrucomicrobiota bacterium]